MQFGPARDTDHGICGCCNVASSDAGHHEITSTSIVTFSAMQNSFRPFAQRAVSNTQRIQHCGEQESQARSGDPDSAGIVFRHERPSTIARIKRSPAQRRSKIFMAFLPEVYRYVFVFPKIAVPTRTQVEPSSIATSKSCDMPMESCSMAMAGSLPAANASPARAACGK